MLFTDRYDTYTADTQDSDAFRDYLASDDDFDNLNMTRRALSVALVDISGSVSDYKDVLENAIKGMIAALMNDAVAQSSAELGIITFNKEPSILLPLREVYMHTDEISLECKGTTNPGAAISLGLKMIDDRSSALRAGGIQTFVPSLFFISDGEPYYGKNASAEFVSECNEQLEKVYEELEKRRRDGDLRIISLGVGSDADAIMLDKVSGGCGNTVYLKDGVDIGAFFKLASSEISSRSRGGRIMTTEQLLEQLDPASRRALRNQKEEE